MMLSTEIPLPGSDPKNGTVPKAKTPPSLPTRK